MVEPTSPTAGVGTRRDYALKTFLCWSAHTSATQIVATVVAFMDAPPRSRHFPSSALAQHTEGLGNSGQGITPVDDRLEPPRRDKF